MIRLAGVAAWQARRADLLAALALTASRARSASRSRSPCMESASWLVMVYMEFSFRSSPPRLAAVHTGDERAGAGWTARGKYPRSASGAVRSGAAGDAAARARGDQGSQRPELLPTDLDCIKEPPALSQAAPYRTGLACTAESASHGLTDRTEDAIHRLVLWNIDLTLVDVVRVTRAAYAEAFPAVTGRPLIKLPQVAGRSESEIFFDALAVNAAELSAGGSAEGLLEPFSAALFAALEARRDDLLRDGQLLPGAAEALEAVAKLDGVVQSVLTGSSKPSAMLKLHAFGLDGFVDFDIGGYGSEAYPKGTLLRVARQRAADKHGVPFGENVSVYVADSPRDVDAARIGGARSLAVASGRASAAELRDAGADAVLPDLTDTAGLTALIVRLTEAPSR